MEDDDDEVPTISCCSRKKDVISSQHLTSSTHNNTWQWSYGLQITPYICDSFPGTIKISMSQPYKQDSIIKWHGLPDSIKLQENGALLNNVQPGKYSVSIENKSYETTRRLEATVPRLDAAIITGYTTKPVTGFPWNGEVKAQVENCPNDVLFLWSNGIVTKINILTHIRPGKYTVTLLNSNITVVSASGPALVENLM